ncbi:MAG: hypothetical protein JNK82_32780 [Myxococcaceae bacterium]|nr:hypothetical protein [Myxococcaceae bacterium]
MRTQALALAVLVSLTACHGGATLDYKLMMPDAPDIIDPGSNPDNLPALTACDFGYSYEGFGGTRLEAGREDEEVGFDRDRVKPYSALSGEYARVLGKAAPALLGQLSSTFGQVPPRWYVEPAATAVSLYSSMRVAFVGCLELTNTTDFDAAPDATNAPQKCTDFAKRFWSRSPDTEEVQACVDVLTNGTGRETVARRKWAYGCASVLSSAPFLTF